MRPEEIAARVWPDRDLALEPLGGRDTELRVVLEAARSVALGSEPVRLDGSVGGRVTSGGEVAAEPLWDPKGERIRDVSAAIS